MIIDYAARQIDHGDLDGQAAADDAHSFCSSISSLDGNDNSSRSQPSSNNIVDNLPFEKNSSSSTTKSVSTPSKLTSDGEEPGIMHAIMMRRGSLGSVEISNMIEERSNIIESIHWLGRHVPRCVLRDLTTSVSCLTEDGDPAIGLPLASTYTGALLFIDMSGFTKLSLMLDLNRLSRFINIYFQKIVDEVTHHGGDILKFAGDAVFAEWRVDKSQNTTPEEYEYECVSMAAACGASVVSKYSQFPIFDDESSQIATLNVHCGLGFGRMACVHVGNDFSRREYLVVGETIEQVSESCNAASYGELAASPEAYDILHPRNTDQASSGLHKPRLPRKPKIIASRNKLSGIKKNPYLKKKPSTFKKKNFSIPFDHMSTASLRCFQKLLSFYVHPVVAADEMTRPPNHACTANIKVIQERHRAEAELRSVYTLFIHPIITAELTNDPRKDREMFKLLDDILNLVTTIIDSFKGHLRQFIVDDKGVVLIANFGLRGSISPNMGVERVLPAARKIHNILQNEFKIDNFIGVTLGKAYCGIVGGIKRHEYAVLGPSVNLAARMLTMPNHPGVLIDNALRQDTAQWGNFHSFPPLIAKGYTNPVPVYQPLTAKEAQWGKINPKFVGREDEINKVLEIATQMSETEGPAKMFFIWGESGSGKSNFLVKTVDITRRHLIALKKNVIVTRYIGNDENSFVPFSLFRSIFLDLIGGIESDVSSTVSHCSRAETIASLQNKDILSISRHTECSLAPTTSRPDELFKEICDELGAPPVLQQIIGYHLLGHQDNVVIQKNAPILSEIVNFMSKIFVYVTQGSDLVIVALDDFHQIDDLSLKVVQNVFETGQNILFVCGSRPIDQHFLHVEEDFWENITGEQKRCGRFYELELGPLNRDEIKQMCAMALSCKSNNIDENFANDIFHHTSGMPYFASQLLQHCMKNCLYSQLDTNKIGWGGKDSKDKLKFSTLDELLLKRYDDLDDFVRKTLHLALVLGSGFTIGEIVDLSEQTMVFHDNAEGGHADFIHRSLDVAVKEGILDEIVASVQDKNINFGMQNLSLFNHAISFKAHDDDEVYFNCHVVKHFRFCNNIWRQRISSLLLDSYKRDIHMHAARAIEVRQGNIEDSDYQTKLRLFCHLKESDNKVKAANLALDIGKSFVHLGLHSHSVHIYNVALDMWRKSRHDDAKDSSEGDIGGFRAEVLDSIEASDLVVMIKIKTALGQALGTLTDKKESVKAFEDALSVLKQTPVGAELKDRSIVFPIYSGLFFLLKYGGFAMVDPSEEKEYELVLVSNFVAETKLHGDPVHYSRALAMLGEFYGRQGQYEKALGCHEKLKGVYDVDKHSAPVCEVYASDRSAQNYGFSANYLYRLGKTDEALEVSKCILTEMLPKMDPKNVHNSMIMIYPIFWIFKEEGMSKEAAAILEKFVIKPFREHFGEDGKTFCLIIYKPLQILFELSMYEEKTIDKIDDISHMIQWFQDDKMEFPNAVVDGSMSSFGRCGTSVCAECCLLLSNHTEDEELRNELIEKAWKLAKIAMEAANNRGCHQTSYIQSKSVHDRILNTRSNNVMCKCWIGRSDRRRERGRGFLCTADSKKTRKVKVRKGTIRFLCSSHQLA